MSVEGLTLYGGPFDGKRLEEQFPPGHLLHGAIPDVVAYPGEGGVMHQYVLDDDRARYSYVGERKERDDG